MRKKFLGKAARLTMAFIIVCNQSIAAPIPNVPQNEPNIPSSDQIVIPAYNRELYYAGKIPTIENELVRNVKFKSLPEGVNMSYLVLGDNLFLIPDSNDISARETRVEYSVQYSSGTEEQFHQDMNLVYETPEQRTLRRGVEDANALSDLINGYFVVTNGKDSGNVFFPTDPNILHIEGIDFVRQETIPTGYSPRISTLDKSLKSYADALRNGGIWCLKREDEVYAERSRWPDDVNVYADPNICSIPDPNSSSTAVIDPNSISCLDGIAKIVRRYTNEPELSQTQTWKELILFFKEKGLYCLFPGGSQFVSSGNNEYFALKEGPTLTIDICSLNDTSHNLKLGITESSENNNGGVRVQINQSEESEEPGHGGGGL